MRCVVQEDVWVGDLLNRQEDANFLRDFLIARHNERRSAGLKGSYVLNLEAEWGHGKTFFMTRLKGQLEQEEYPVIYIDAWKNDFSDDPYTNVIAEIERYFQQYVATAEKNQNSFVKAYDALKQNAGKIFWLGLKGGLKRGSRWLIAEGADQIIEVVDKHVVVTGETATKIAEDLEEEAVRVTDEIIDAYATKRIKDFEEAKASLERFRESLSSLLRAFKQVSAKKLPLFILVDELDRCRPTYAISMLERIKHLFDVDDVIFILSTDTKQLAHSISGVYGQSFDSQRYLRRFFTRTFLLPRPSPQRMVDALIQASGVDENKWQAPGVQNDRRAFIAEASRRLGMSLRDIEQAIDILLSLTTVWRYNFPIQLLIMYPMIYGYLRENDVGDFRLGSENDKSVTAAFSSWLITDEGSIRHRRFSQQNSVATYYRKLWDGSAVTLEDFYRRNDANDWREAERDIAYVDVWTNSVINSEFSSQSAAGMPSTQVRTIIRSYPELIRYAGRLSN